MRRHYVYDHDYSPDPQMQGDCRVCGHPQQHHVKIAFPKEHMQLTETQPMGTTQSPSKNDCYHRALPDEPTFTLLARDPQFREIVSKWANDRAMAIECGERPESDRAIVAEARRVAEAGAKWRKENNGKWRKPEAPGLKVGKLYEWSRTGILPIYVRLVALEGDEACVHDGDRMVIVNKKALS